MERDYAKQALRYVKEIWDENSLLGRACYAYNAESSKSEHWGHNTSPFSRHIASMRMALLELGFKEEDLEPETARRPVREEEWML